MLVSAKIILITITAILAAVACSIISSYAFSAQKRIDKQGIIGIWNDKAGLSTMTIERTRNNYKMIWVSSGGFRAESPLFRDGIWLKKKSPLGVAYQIHGDRLDIYDNTGFVRSVDLMPDR